MKHSYQKPELYAETFEMVEHIASGCAGAYSQLDNEHPYHDGANCLYLDEANETYFTANTTYCQYADNPVPPGAILDGLFNCYQGPAGGSATPFHS